jgi:inward rectifier potassium channel
MPIVEAPPPSRRRRTHAVNLGGGDIVSHGMPVHFWQDLYHRMLTMRWPVFFSAAAALFLLLNTGFALLYELGDHAIANQSPAGFGGAFFFSVETLATVGYGDMHPRTVFGHLIATLEIFSGMSGIALVTGMIFARFSRPHARIIFASQVVVRPIDGVQTLLIRAANARQNVIVEAAAKLRLVRQEMSPEGFEIRKIYDLPMLREQHPIFALTWTLMHVIDASSPLFEADPDSLAAAHANLLLTIEGVDETTSQAMRARHAWSPSEIHWNYKYRDVLYNDAQGVSHVDYSVFHETLPL